MKILCDSSLHDYALEFWTRESLKNDVGREALKQINIRNADPVELLRREQPNGHRDKLPQARNDIVRLARLDSKEEVEGLHVHRRILCDDWMRTRGLKVDANTTCLGDIAKAFTEYFERDDANGTQVKCYRKWKAGGTLDGVLSGSINGTPLVERDDADEFEIVDGWGRLLPFVFLLQNGFAFHPVKVFIADRTGDALVPRVPASTATM